MQSISDFICDLGAGRGNITVSTAIYSIEAIHAATYPFTDGYHILTACNGENAVTVIFEAKDRDGDVQEALKAFANTLIDHQVRYQLDRANGRIRDLIVAHAFSPLDLHKETGSL